jgi:hypothetical protein
MLSVSHNCFHKGVKSGTSQSIRAVRVSAAIPMVLPDTSYVITNSYEIFYRDDLILYKFRYRFDSAFNGKWVLQEFRPNIFVFEKDSLYGYSYYPRPDRSISDGRIAIDSVWAKNAVTPFQFDTLLKSKPIATYFDSQKNWVKVYDYPRVDTTSEKFTYYLYYSKKLFGLTDCFFSRSNADESGMKLFKVRIVAHGHFYQQYKMILPERQFLYEMLELPLIDTGEVMKYFDHYKKDVAK